MKYECTKCKSTGKLTYPAHEDECNECGQTKWVEAVEVPCYHCYGQGGFDNDEDYAEAVRKQKLDSIMAFELMKTFKEPSFFMDAQIEATGTLSEPVKFEKIMKLGDQ